MAQMKRIQVSVPDEVLATLKEVSRFSGVPLSAVAGAVLSDWHASLPSSPRRVHLEKEGRRARILSNN